MNETITANVPANVEFLGSMADGVTKRHEDGAITPATSASSTPPFSPSPSPSPEVPPCVLPPAALEGSGTEGADAAGESGAWSLTASAKSLRTRNPIRAIVDPIMLNSVKCGRERGEGKDQISLALGDPTAFGDLPPCPAAVSAVADAILSPMMGGTSGYVNACGLPAARAAVAKHHSGVARPDPDDVIIANGASGALELALTALLDEGSVLLVPRPGFPLYQVIAESHGASVAHYDLLPDRGWECDLDQLEGIILHEESKNESPGRYRRVRGILVNNPSNPTGAVYSEQYLMGIVRLAQKHRLPLIADEIYGDMTFGSAVFHPMADVAARLGRTVPVITASGLGKQYLVPGWRLGWAVFQDNCHGAIQEVREGARRLAQVILGASHLAQVAIPAVLDPPDEAVRLSTAAWKTGLYSAIERRAGLLCGLLDECHGLSSIYPEGAMYAMVRIDTDAFDDSVSDDVSFMRVLLEEENVVVLPGSAFGLAGCHAFRVVTCAPEDVLATAVARIKTYCLRHAE